MDWNLPSKAKVSVYQGEFVYQSKASFIRDHFLYSHDLNMWFRLILLGEIRCYSWGLKGWLVHSPFDQLIGWLSIINWVDDINWPP